MLRGISRAIIDALIGRMTVISMETGTPVTLSEGDRLIIGRDKIILITRRQVSGGEAPARLQLRRVDSPCMNGFFLGRGSDIEEWVAGGGYVVIQRTHRAKRLEASDALLNYAASLKACPAMMGFYAPGGRGKPIGAILPNCYVPCDVVRSGVSRYMSLTMSWLK
ncbi:MAG: hypothetical protein RXO22_01990 [Thermocladium sp.]|jgi:hypothetical protein